MNDHRHLPKCTICGEIVVIPEVTQAYRTEQPVCGMASGCVVVGTLLIAIVALLVGVFIGMITGGVV